MKLFIPESVKFIIDTFFNNNFEAFMVGGCIRDALLNRNPGDYDIATSAKPTETISLFKKTVPTGIKHGTITVFINKEGFEVTTYRTEGEYKDNRRPESVSFVTNIKEDLSRRDFTINAFAYNSKVGLLDYFNGISDLDKKLIRTVGNSNLRFQEDALRMLRAIRFSSQLDFNIESETLIAITKNKNLITSISVERIQVELNKILLSNNPKKGLLLLKDTGLLSKIIPNFNFKENFSRLEIFNTNISAIEYIKPILSIRLAALFRNIGPDKKDSAKKTIDILKSLKYDNKTIDTVFLLITEDLQGDFSLSIPSIKRLINRVKLNNIFLLYNLQESYIKEISRFSNETFNELIDKTNKILSLKEPLTIKDLAISGNDLIALLNFPKGKTIGTTLNYLLDLVLDDPTLNKKELLLEKAKAFSNRLL